MVSGSGKKRGRGVREPKRSSGRLARLLLLLAIVALVVALAVFTGVVIGREGGDSAAEPGATATPTGDAVTVTQEPTSDVDDPTSTPTDPPPTPTLGPVLACGDILVPVSKTRSLPADCAPTDLQELPERMTYRIDLAILLRAEAAAALTRMLDAAREDGLVIVVRSAYRSYDQQEQTYAYNVAQFGQEYADRSSARAGHSEHQLGTTGDLTSASNGFELEGFENTPEGQWVAVNATSFGFVISYPEGSEAITGYVYEPWHVRYVGLEVAAAIADSGLTPVEFLEQH